MSLPSISKFGGWRNAQTARFDLIPGEALEAVAEVFAEGETKYGRLQHDPYYPNWVGLDLSSDQSPLSHALNHLAHVQMGASINDGEDHLASAAANILIMLWFRDADSSLVQGLTWPEVVRYYYKRRQEEEEQAETPWELQEEQEEYYESLDTVEAAEEPNIFERILAKVTS